MKEVKARLNFEGCSGRNSKIQEVLQYSKSGTPNKRGDLRRRLKPRRSRSMSRSLKPTSVFSRIRRDRSPSSRHRVWFDDLPSESVDSYDDLKKSFLSNFLQPKKCIKDPVEIHDIKQREGESTEDIVQRFKTKSMQVKGSPECMRISGFMHRITNPELIKRLHDNILKSMDEMMRVTTAFLRGGVAASNQHRNNKK
ncbi:reverse transcriptase domain-containing protein [Tanacetum coccineum]